MLITLIDVCFLLSILFKVFPDLAAWEPCFSSPRGGGGGGGGHGPLPLSLKPIHFRKTVSQTFLGVNHQLHL